MKWFHILICGGMGNQWVTYHQFRKVPLSSSNQLSSCARSVLCYFLIKPAYQFPSLVCRLVADSPRPSSWLVLAQMSGLQWIWPRLTRCAIIFRSLLGPQVPEPFSVGIIQILEFMQSCTRDFGLMKIRGMREIDPSQLLSLTLLWLMRVKPQKLTTMVIATQG